jgi:hypothetical protein
MQAALSAAILQAGPGLQVEVLLLCLGGAALVAVAVYTVVYYRRRSDRSWDEDDLPTEVVRDARSGTPQAYLLAEEEYRIAPSQIELYSGMKTTIGRNSHECTVQINDIGISRHHAVIASRNGRFYLRDSRSRGGTFLYRKITAANERKDRPRLSEREERLLSDGDVVKFYTFAYRFQEGESTISRGEHPTEYGTEHEG